MKKITPFILLSVISCSSPKIHIPGYYENKFIYSGQDEAAATKYSIREAGKLAELYPDEDIVNDEIKITMRFEQNDKYDTLAFKKIGEQAKKKKKEDDKSNSAKDAEQLAKDLEKLLNTGDFKNISVKLNNAAKSKSDEVLTENPLPDGEVFTNTKFEYEYTTIKDFVNEPFVVEYNSMTKPKNFSFKIDDKTAELEKEKEKNEGDYFKTDSRYLVYNMSLPIRGTRVNARYFESCRDAKFNNIIFIPELHHTVKKVIKISKPDWLDFEIIEKNFEGLEFKKEEIEESGSNDDDDDNSSRSSKKKQKFIVYTFKNLKAYQRYRDGRGASYNIPMLHIHYKSIHTPKVNKDIFNTTDDLYKWYRQVTGILQNDTAKFGDFTRNLVKDAKTDEEKIKRVFYWIQDNVRYIAFEDGIAGFRPDECSNVFAKKYGDCKGMANLCRNMLKVLGFDARMVWIGTRHLNFSYDIPGLNVDNHAICAVKLNGQFVFLDATETYCSYGDYANRIQGRRCIVEDGDKYTIERIPEFGPEHNESMVNEGITMKNGRLEVKGSKTFKGESKIVFLREYNLLRLQSRDLVLYTYLTNGKIFIDASDISSSDLSNRDIDAKINYTLDIANHMFVNKGKTYINLAWDREFDDFDFDTTRKVDFDFGSKANIQSKLVLNIETGKKVVLLPKPVKVDNPYYSFNLEIVQEGNALVYKKSMITKTDYLPVSMLRQMNKDSELVKEFYNTYIVLEN